MTRRRLPAWLLVVAFIVVPLLEIFVLIQVGQVIGPWWTILLLVADSILGTWLIRREGGRAWSALRAALNTGTMPARELADGALILVGGTLMLSPGFVTDAVGIALILPFTRPLARRALTRVVGRRLLGAGVAAYTPRTGPGGASRQDPRNARRPHPDPGGSVVEGEVVD
ncbi:MAG: Cytoplasmic membrane protein FsxA [uncultured Nocardioides sp.]|uniref:Cytoplasmic membrane protein FsxA n=1 Tax=uncultured Nocardioides sp. TaxID=198441 RepID=A0A6J4NVK5_9ACTN|nr:MAG: Cytoplasmic membrane protein FsxA [uncultured Nocardioides sp.]